MNLQSLDLRNKTFLDFTNDKKIINEIIGGDDACFFLDNIDDSSRIASYLEFAELTGDSNLAKAIMKEFSVEAGIVFNFNE